MPWLIARIVLALVPAGIIVVIALCVSTLSALPGGMRGALIPAIAASVITFGLLGLVPDPESTARTGRTVALVLLVPAASLPIALGLWVGGLVGKGSQEASCIAALFQLQGAKAAWAHEHEKASDDLPIWSDLIGPDRYLAHMPRCAGGGKYTLCIVGEPPRCSIPGHVLELSYSSNQVLSGALKH